jgi:tetratricopeptide (TPR) repeat protein
MLSSTTRALLLLIAVFLCQFTRIASAEQTWREVKSPHFRVLTDGSSNQGRMVANEFEQMRHVFALRFNNDEIESGAPLTIVAARDIGTLRELEPLLWKAQGDKVAGEFHRGWEKQFALVRLDTWGDSNEVVIYHEYTHSILHANTHWLPTWLDEGLAEFYAYTRFGGEHIYIGAPSRRTNHLRGTLVPVDTMLDVNARSPYYHEAERMQLFYAEAWAMVHYMVFGDGMENGEKLAKFIHMLQDGVNQQKAFREVFGDSKTFDESLSQYVRRYSFNARVLPPDRGFDPKSFPARDLSPAEADYELGCFHIGAHDLVAGRTLIEKSLSLDPKLGGADEELGFLDFVDGRDEKAKEEWKEAVTLDPSRARSLFALTMSDVSLANESPEQLRATQAALKHVTELAPKFAPGYVELALTEWRLGLIQAAFKDARKAEMLEPSRAGYHILTGRILLQGQQPAIAADYSRYVAAHWFGPDHNEAVDLWEAVPPARRGDGPALALDFPAGSEVARGKLLNVSCNKEAGVNKISVSFVPDEPAGAQPLTFVSDGHMMAGFSDTLWWGEDHFTLCHHLSGLPAVLAYKRQGSQGGELVDLEIRDDSPVSPPVMSQARSEAASVPAH